MTAITPQQQHALDIARSLAELGMPLFLAPPDPDHWSKTGYALPVGWQRTVADPSVVDRWRPGMALCAVTGVVLDLIDVDDRSGGAATLLGTTELRNVPVLGVAQTPSGGQHRFVLPIGVASRDGAWPGVDVKSGTEDGHGRGFAFLAPTVRRSKVTGQPTEYSWIQAPDSARVRDALNWVRTHGNPHARPIRERIESLRAPRASHDAPRRLPRSVAAAEWQRAVDKLTTDLRHWAQSGWGGEAHAGLLAASTHLARLSPEHSLSAYQGAFVAAGLQPDEQDMAKIYSAISAAVPDIVVPDDQMTPEERFWAGAEVPEARAPGADVPDPRPAGLGPSPTAQAGFTFAPVTRARYRDRTPPRQATLGAFGGAHGLFYASGVHWLQGESESGKSWVAQALAAERLRAGERVLYVDYEDTEDAVLGRFAALSVTDDQIELLTYVPAGEVLFSELVAHVVSTEYALMVVDGVTTSISSASLSGRDEQEVTRWTDLLPRRARMAVCVDHVVKAVDERQGMAIGSQAKKSVVTGTAWEVVCPPTGKFGQGKSGYLVLNLQKDKPGGVRGLVGHRGQVVKVLVDPITGTVTLGAKRTEEVVQAEAYQEASKAAADLVEAEKMYMAIMENCNTGASMRSVISWAIGSEKERAMAKGKGSVGAHPDWDEFRLRSAWRVWAHTTGNPKQASVSGGLEEKLHDLVKCTQPGCEDDLQKPFSHPGVPGQTTNGFVWDSHGVGTKPNTIIANSPFDLPL